MADEIADQLVDALAGLIRLPEDEHGEVAPDQGHRPMAHLRRAECFSVEAAGFLELERGFLGNPQARSTPDDVKAASVREAFD